ncbi:MAG: hypothetical protein ACXV6L_10250 [Halobacteriota archaeon]
MSAHRDHVLWAYRTVVVLCIAFYLSGLAIPALAAPEGNRSTIAGDGAQLTEPLEVPIASPPTQVPADAGTSPAPPPSATTSPTVPVANATALRAALPSSSAAPQQTSEEALHHPPFVVETPPISGGSAEPTTVHVTQPTMDNASLASLQSFGSGGNGYLPLVGLSGGTAVLTLAVMRYWALAYDTTAEHLSYVVEEATPTVTTHAVIDPADSSS